MTHDWFVSNTSLVLKIIFAVDSVLACILSGYETSLLNNLKLDTVGKESIRRVE
jgi:hypothetical protein